MRRLLALLMTGLVGLSGATTVLAAPPSDWETHEFVHYSHAGPGPHPDGESDRYHQLKYKPRWFSGDTVEYRIVGAPFAAAETAVERSAATIDQYVTTRSFRRSDGTQVKNPCTGEPNTVRWTWLDGPGGVLAVADVCQNKYTGEVGGFRITLDTGDGWAIGADGDPATFDVENVATHEMGHAAGLGHVSAPKDGCLTMYDTSGPEETQKRTLGWGDKIGMDALYATRDTAPGPGCGV